VYAAEDAKGRVGKVEDQVRALAGQDDILRATLEALAARAEPLPAAVEALRGRAETLATNLATLSRGLAADLSTKPADLSTKTADLSTKTADLSTKTADLSAEMEVLDQQLSAVRAEIMFQQRRLTRLAIPAAARPVEESAAVIVDQRLDSLYTAFEDVFRGSREDIKRRLLPYVDRLLLAGAGQHEKPIVDIGCGRGEWLELLKEKGLHAYGIDINTMMVERCLSLRLDARHAELLAHLDGIEDASRSALTAFHVVEHLPFATLVSFLDEALRVVIPGGLLILETPNPETIRVGATTFYNDPTHRNPLMPEPLQFIVRHRGFCQVKIIKMHPFTQGLLQAATPDAVMLNRVLFGPQDYAIVARRP
jgi:O-antigen chain-terminating methyltransferase